MNKARPNRPVDESTRECRSLNANINNSILINKQTFDMFNLVFRTWTNKKWCQGLREKMASLVKVEVKNRFRYETDVLVLPLACIRKR